MISAVQITLFSFQAGDIYIHLMYVGLLILIVIALIQWQKKRLNKEKKKWLRKQQIKHEKTHHQEVSAFQDKIQQLEKSNHKLQKDIRRKSIELAKKAKQNNANNHILHQVKDKIVEIEKNPSVISKIRLKEMRRLLESYLEIEDNTFEIQIDEIHQEFFKLLKSQFPDLTTYDLRLSAYLKMGLNTREIAEIIHVLPSSINVSRSRLRKKLDLEPDQDLYEFMNHLEAVEVE